MRAFDESQTVRDVAISPEIKGVRGTDRRKYLLDLMRVFPRDSNYPDPAKHGCCVLRPELISRFKSSN